MATLLAVLEVLGTAGGARAEARYDFQKMRQVPSYFDYGARANLLSSPDRRYVPLKHGHSPSPYSYLECIADGAMTRVKAQDVPRAVRAARGGLRDFIQNGLYGDRLGKDSSAWRQKRKHRSPLAFNYLATQKNKLVGYSAVYDLATGMATAFVKVDKKNEAPDWMYLGSGSQRFVKTKLKPGWYRMDVGYFAPRTYQPDAHFLPKPTSVTGRLSRMTDALRGNLAGKGGWRAPLAKWSSKAPIVQKTGAPKVYTRFLVPSIDGDHWSK